MSTRLLPKYEIDKRRAEEERQRMEEGLQIAGRVDTLRETVASEEVAFEKYRVGRLKSIQEEIGLQEQKRNELDALVIQAKAEYERLTAPLDRKWEEVKKVESELILKETSLKDWENLLIDNESSLDFREKEIESKEKLIEIQSQSAISHANKAKTLFEQTKTESEKMRIDCQFRESELAKKEISFEAIEHEFITQRDILLSSMKDREAELAQREKAVQEAWIKIDDERKTLERAFKRLNK